MGGLDAVEKAQAFPNGGPHAASAPEARIKSTGRVGKVVGHDPSDPALTYKLEFSDGALPAADWFAGTEVELLSGEEAPLAGSKPVVEDAFQAAKNLKLQQWAPSRPAGTPVQDEGFICMGSRAPRCPKPVQQQGTGPVTLDVLQGSWTGSGGAQIVVIGTNVILNGLPLKDHRVELSDDGIVLSIGRLWQLAGWTQRSGDAGLEFRASSTRENMDCARSEIWTRKTAGEASSAETERLRLLGYAGSAADPLARGVEGCLPGTLGAEMRSTEGRDAKDVALLGTLVMQWREPELCTVRSCKVVPDATNRAQTGLGVELVHFVAYSMGEKGFRKREGNDGHDIPVVVREPPNSDTHIEALKLWSERVAEEEGFPPVRVTTDEEMFTSLGNGHFFQALNCYACEIEKINAPGKHYAIGQDKALADAIANGVPSVVLRHETPRPVRAKIAELLNAKRDFMWTLREDGTVDVMNATENTSYCSQFEWLSKGMDAHQVNCLVRTHLGIRDSKRIEG